MKHNGIESEVRKAGEDEVLEARGSRLVIKVATERQFVCEYTAPELFPGPPLHVHPGFDETFVVLEGRLEVQMDHHRLELMPGEFACVDGDVPHSFRGASEKPVRFLLICTPGGFEDYFRGIASGNGRLVAKTSERFGYRPVEVPAGAGAETAVHTAVIDV